MRRRRGAYPLTGNRPEPVVGNAFDFAGKAELLQKLGKHKGGLKQCLYINKLADVDLDVLRTIIKAGVVQAKNTWPVTPS